MSQRLRDGHGILRLRGAVYMESRVDLRVGGYLHKQEEIEQPNLKLATCVYDSIQKLRIYIHIYIYICFINFLFIYLYWCTCIYMCEEVYAAVDADIGIAIDSFQYPL